MKLPAPAGATSAPSMASVPALGASMRVTRRLSVDLPEPDSPTTASVSPAARVKETPASAFTVALPPKKPRFTA